MSLADPRSVCWVVSNFKGYTELPKGCAAPHTIRLKVKLQTPSQCFETDMYKVMKQDSFDRTMAPVRISL